MNNITILSERIRNPKVKDYFEEVMNSFYSKSFRSAIVMLYSVTICDIIYKLTELAENYNNNASISILQAIETSQNTDEFSSKWEELLVNECFNKKIVVDIVLKDEIESLRKLRNLCAHPILKNDNKNLHKPNKETTLAHIVTIVDELFSKSTLSYAFRDVFEKFSNDVDRVKSNMSLEELGNYVNKVYLNKINNFEIEYRFFKKLWTFSFNKTDEKCEDNRMANVAILELLFAKYSDPIIQKMQIDEDGFYMQNTTLPSLSCLKWFIYFTNRNDTYNFLTKELKEFLKNKISDTNDCQMAVFLSSDISTHYSQIYTTIISEIDHLFEIAELKKNRNFALDFLIKLYGDSYQFNDADLFFNNFIKPHLNEFSHSQLEQLIIVSDLNSQIYSRRNGKESNTLIGERMKENDNSFDFKKYTNFLDNSFLQVL